MSRANSAYLSSFFNIFSGYVKKVFLRTVLGLALKLTFQYQYRALLLKWSKFTYLRVKMGNFSLDFLNEIGYNNAMIANFMIFILRIGVVIAFWGFIWKIIEPRTQCRRIVRALLLTLGLLGILTVLRTVGGWYLGQCVFPAIPRLVDDFCQFFRFNSK